MGVSVFFLQNTKEGIVGGEGEDEAANICI